MKRQQAQKILPMHLTNTPRKKFWYAGDKFKKELKKSRTMGDDLVSNDMIHDTKWYGNCEPDNRKQTFPNCLKKARVLPLKKMGKLRQVNNLYRPIS